MEWRDIPGYPGYMINAKGRVRTRNGYSISRSARGIYQLTRNGERERVAVADLIALAFPPVPGPAQAETSLEALLVQAVHEMEPEPAALEARSYKTSQKKQYGSAKRKCASCGRPTVNYRCSKCWEKIRGFGLEDPRMNVYGE